MERSPQSWPIYDYVAETQVNNPTLWVLTPKRCIGEGIDLTVSRGYEDYLNLRFDGVTPVGCWEITTPYQQDAFYRRPALLDEIGLEHGQVIVLGSGNEADRHQAALLARFLSATIEERPLFPAFFAVADEVVHPRRTKGGGSHVIGHSGHAGRMEWAVNEGRSFRNLIPQIAVDRYEPVIVEERWEIGLRRSARLLSEPEITIDVAREWAIRFSGLGQQEFSALCGSSSDPKSVKRVTFTRGAMIHPGCDE